MLKTLRYLLTGIVFVPTISFSQYWIRNFGSTLNDEGTDISIDAAGNTYSTGYFSALVNFGGTSLGSNGLTDVFVVKTDPAGVVLWAQKGGGTGSDRGVGIKADAAGNCYVTGFYTGSATFGAITINAVGGSQDVFVAKYNSAGVLQWVKSGGGTSADIAYGVNVDNSGNVAITGQFKSTATFGAFSQTSMIDPATMQPSGDIFIVKYNSAGVEQWFEAGKAEKDDWGTDIAADASGNFYITGHFSDTITFDNTHNNQMINAAFLIKYNGAGVEQWFRRMGGTQTSTYGIVVDGNNNVYITGDFLGSLSFFNGVALVGTLTNTYSDKVFIAKYDSNGTLTWHKADGSDSEISSRNIALDNTGDPYIIGFFKCRAGDYADLYGQGTFNSVGFKDIFVTKYNSAGVRQWARSCGGQKDDNPGGITVNSAGEIFIAGSFDARIVFASDVASPTDYNTVSLFNVANGSYCNDANYGAFKAVVSEGALDILVAKNINFNREPYDYYHRTSGSCIRDYVDGCINVFGTDINCGPDSIEQCGTPVLNAVTNTSFSGPFNYSGAISAGPDFTYIWSTGATTKTTVAPSTGFYWVTMTTADGCFTSDDTIHVTINPPPPLPTITDSKGININTSFTQTIELCEPDSVTLWGGGYGSLQHNWGGTPGYTTVNPHTIQVFESGSYYFTVVDANGCSSTASVQVVIDGELDTINPVITIYQPTPINDTIFLCPGGTFSILVYDSITNPTGQLLPQPIEYSCPSSTWAVTPACSYYTGSPHCNLGIFTPNQNGLYNISYTLIRVNVCDTDTVVLSIPVIVELYPIPTVPPLTITGPTTMCPGDTVTLTAAGGSNYTWSGPGIIGPTNGTTIQVNQTGIHSVSVTVTNQYGCSASAGASHVLSTPAAPFIVMNPPNGVICPGGSVTINVQSAGTYQWYGPNGLMTQTGSFIVVTAPGFYYCVVTNNGCAMVSNTVEVKQYTTPVLTAQPSSVICPGDSVVIQVQAVVTTNIVWQSPLSGNSLTQTIYTPGTYVCSITSCGITTTDTIEVTQGNPQATIQPGGTFTICDLDTLTLTANAGQAQYVWSPGGQGTQSIGVTDPGTYFVSITDIYGCSDISDSVVVNVLPPVQPPVVNNITICAGIAPLLTASGSGTLTWYANASGGTPLTTGTTFQAPAINAPTTYYVQSTDAAQCESIMVPLNVNIHPSSLLPAIFVNATNFCEGDTIELSTNAIPNGIYNWTGPNMFTSNVAVPTPFAATLASQGTYFLNIGDNFCNSPVASVNITVTPTPVAPTLTAPCDNVCIGDSVIIFATSPSSTQFAWQTPTGIVITGSPYMANATSGGSGIYSVTTMVGTCGSGQSDYALTVSPCNLLIPNVFSPNKDASNPVFTIESPELEFVHCVIFNRWGTKVHEWNTVNGFWDGTIDGKQAPDAVYYVLIEYRFCSDQETIEYKGFVHLLR